ncbi:MAG: M1 family aminopeptidase [Planctomycetia bacterium]
MLPQRFVPVLCAGLLLAACAGLPASQAPSLSRPQRELASRQVPFDVEHYSIELALHPERRAIEGACRVRLWSKESRVDEVVLDLDGLEVRGVRDERGAQLEFEHAGDKLAIRLARPLARDEWCELSIAYGGSPRTGLHWAGVVDGVPTQAWTQGECDEARGWFPCFDEPRERATHELVVDAPAHWTIVAAGERIERVESGARARERWRATFPHPSYLVTLAAGEFASAHGEFGSTPLSFHGPRALAGELLPAFEETDEILAYFSELTGVRYPHPKYAQTCVDDFHYGGMENLSATTLTDTALFDAKGRADQPITGLVAHEAAHQWFGDLLTCAEWSEIWLNEGFATYLTLLWTERSRGRDAFLCEMRDTQESYLRMAGERSRRAVVHGLGREPMELFFSGHVYPGGAARLQLLRGMLGDERFEAALRRWTGLNLNRAVTTAEFVDCVEASSGMDLARFEREWLRGRGHPIVVARHERTAHGVILHLEQVQDAGSGIPAAFAFPLEVEFGDKAGGTTRRVEVDERVERFELGVDGDFEWVRLDPGAFVPMDLRHAISGDEALAQLAHAGDAQGRRAAARLLGKELSAGTDAELKRRIGAALLGRLAAERAKEPKVAIVQALAPFAADEAHDALVAAAAADPFPAVRVAALEALAAAASRLAPEALSALVESARASAADAPSWAVEGAAVQLLAACGALDLDGLRAQLAVASPHGARESRVVAAIGRSADPRARDLLEQVALDASRADATRGVALAALAPALQSDPALAKRLLALLESDRYRVRRAAIEQLGRVRTAQVAAALRALHARSAYDDERLRIEDSPALRE